MSDKTKCVWTEEGPWVTDCGHAFEVIEGTPADNGFKFCCFCGRPIVEGQAEEPDEEEG